MAIVAMMAVGCGDDAEGAGASSAQESTEGELPAAEGAGEENEGGLDGPSGVVGEEEFTVRGVLARRMRESDPTIEMRLYGRAVSCETFEDDYEHLEEDESVIIMFLRWPREAGDEVPFRAALTEERFQFCYGRPSGRALCRSREPEQGSLTVVSASPEGGTLDFALCSNGS